MAKAKGNGMVTVKKNEDIHHIIVDVNKQPITWGVKKRTYTQAQNRATQKYIKTNYDEFKIRLNKGKKEVVKDYAEREGESLNGYIKKAITNRIKNDTGDDIEL